MTTHFTRSAKQRVIDWRKANPEKYKSQQKRREGIRSKQYKKNPAGYLYRVAKYRAKKVGIPFTIEEADVVVPKLCPILDIEIDVCTSNYHNGASLDRVVNSLGYIPGNVRVISRKANRIKGDATMEELAKVLEYMEGKR